MREFIYNLFMDGHTVIGIICSLLYFIIPVIAMVCAAAVIQKIVEEIDYKFFK